MDIPLSKREAQEKFSTLIQENRRKLDQLEHFKNEYDDLYNVLQTLPHKITHKIMVPVSNVAFMEGYLDRTNEVYALIGDDYFLKCSCQHAMGIVERRNKFVQENISKATKDFENIKSKLGLATEVLDVRKTEDGFFEIIEQLNEEDDDIELVTPHSSNNNKPSIVMLSSDDESEEEIVKIDVEDKVTENNVNSSGFPPVVKKFKDLKVSDDNNSDSLIVNMGMTLSSNPKVEENKEPQERVSKFKAMMMKKKGL